MRVIRTGNSTADLLEGIGFLCSTLGLFAGFFTLFSGCASLRQSECDEITSSSTEASIPSRFHEQKGIRLVDKAKWESAAQAFEQAIALDRSNGKAHNNLGLAYYHQRKLALAAAEFELASSLLPEDPVPLNNLGMTLEAAGRGLDSLGYYARAHELAPNKPLYLGNLVRNRIRLEDFDDSLIEQLQALLFIETRPEWIEWVNDQLAMERNPLLDRGPPPPNLGSATKGTRGSSVDSSKPLFSNPNSNRAAQNLLNLSAPDWEGENQLEIISPAPAVPRGTTAPSIHAPSSLPAPIVPGPGILKTQN